MMDPTDVLTHLPEYIKENRTHFQVLGDYKKSMAQDFKRSYSHPYSQPNAIAELL